MVYRLEPDYGRQWGYSFAFGAGVWFLGVSFAKMLPPSVQVLFFALPIVAFGYCWHILPQWQRQGRDRELRERLTEAEAANLLMRQHQLTTAAQDVDFDGAMRALADLYPAPEPVAPEPVAPAIEQATQLEQSVTQAAGAIGWEFCQYCAAKGAGLTDADGFIKLSRVRSTWGRNRGLKTDDLRALVQSFVALGMTEWRDGRCQEFRPLGSALGS